MEIGNRFIYNIFLLSRAGCSIFTTYKLQIANLSFFEREVTLYFVFQIYNYFGTGLKTRTEGDKNLIFNS